MPAKIVYFCLSHLFHDLYTDSFKGLPSGPIRKPYHKMVIAGVDSGRYIHYYFGGMAG
jgi:hypothetical protein